jgi:ankyrin repeat protein
MLQKTCHFAIDQLCDVETIEKEKQFAIIRELVEAKIDLNYGESKLLFCTVSNNYHDIVKYLIDHGINVRARNDRILINVCMNFDDILFELFLSLGVDVNKHIDNLINILRSGICHSETDKIIKILDLIISSGADISQHYEKLFCEACKYSRMDIINYLMGKGVSCCASDNAPIRSIIKRGVLTDETLRTMRFLFQNGADPNIKICEKRYNGKWKKYTINLLELSVLTRNLDLCKLLFEFGAQANLCINIINQQCDLFSCFILYLPERDQNTNEIIQIFDSHGLDIRHAVEKSNNIRIG